MLVVLEGGIFAANKGYSLDPVLVKSEFLELRILLRVIQVAANS